ncbi:response regulator transcription factor [Massilia sp. W12]|uniref:response regulator transcription factor n=1 Tax=Massilia sp. W12 TaxID=3126507 RepID=UPI0030D2399A
MIDDHKLLMDALSINLSDNFRVTAVSNRREMRLALRNEKYAVALLDLYLGQEGDGLSLLPELLERGAKVLIFSGTSDQAAIRASIRMGAHGFVDKAWELRHLHAALRAVLDDHLAYPQELLSQVLREPKNMVPYLSEREVMLLDMLLKQPMPSNEEMAAVLLISTGRVKNCLTELYSKFNVENRHALVDEARRRGYFPGMHPARMAGKIRSKI